MVKECTDELRKQRGYYLDQVAEIDQELKNRARETMFDDALNLAKSIVDDVWRSSMDGKEIDYRVLHRGDIIHHHNAGSAQRLQFTMPNGRKRTLVVMDS